MRSKWKGPFLSNFFFNVRNKNNLVVFARNSIIPSFLINKTVNIYSGKVFKKVLVTRDKIGYKFGHFCQTRNLKKNKKL